MPAQACWRPASSRSKHSRAADTSYHAEYEDKLKGAGRLGGSGPQAIGSHLAADDQQQLLAAVDKEGRLRGAQKVLALGREKKQQDAADVSDGLASMAFDTALTQIDKLSRRSSTTAGRQCAGGERVSPDAGRAAGHPGRRRRAGVLLAVVITRNVIRQLGGEPRQASEAVQAMAAGDLGVTIGAARREDSLLGRIQAMQRSLSGVVQRVRLNADSVATASQEIASGNFDLSQRTVDQASSLQNTAASMSMWGHGTAERGERDPGQSSGDQRVVDRQLRWRTGPQKVVETMREIDESSRRIADIIGVIDGIAFQTNILALNAAVGSGACRRTGPRVRGGGRRGAATSPSAAPMRPRRSEPDHRQRRAGATRHRTGGSVGATMAEIVSRHRPGDADHGRDQLGSVARKAAGSASHDRPSSRWTRPRHNAALVEQTAAAAESPQAAGRRSWWRRCRCSGWSANGTGPIGPLGQIGQIRRQARSSRSAAALGRRPPASARPGRPEVTRRSE